MKIRVTAPWRRALPAVGLVAVAAYLFLRVPGALVASWGRLDAARHASKDDAAAALARFRGPDYAAAIARIRETLPETTEYLLFESPTQAFVRFDLAPRRAVFGGRPQDFFASVTPARLGALPKWTVTPNVDTGVPALVETRLLAGKGTRP